MINIQNSYLIVIGVHSTMHLMRPRNYYLHCVCEQVTSGRTALHLAASLGFKDVAKVLLQRKALVTVEDAKGCTPLYLAASNGNYEIAKLIIASPDCDMNALTKVYYDPY